MFRKGSPGGWKFNLYLKYPYSFDIDNTTESLKLIKIYLTHIH